MSTVTAIVPGSAFATAALHMVLLHPCDQLVAKWPVTLCKYVDDLAIAYKGRSREVAEELPEAVKWFFNRLEGDLQLEVSKDVGAKKGKSVAIASNKWLKEALRPKLATMGVSFATTVKNLGVQAQGVGMRKAKEENVRAKRFREVQRRLRKALVARQRGAKISGVLKTGLKPAAIYGHRARGMTPGQVGMVRRLISLGLPGRHQGKDTLLRLACWGEDPGPECMAAPIEAWACVVWDALVEEAALHQAWKRQQIRLGLNPRWREVNGPAGSCVMVAKEIGWRWPAWHTFLSREGQRMDMRHTCPMDVAAMAKKGCGGRDLVQMGSGRREEGYASPRAAAGAGGAPPEERQGGDGSGAGRGSRALDAGQES